MRWQVSLRTELFAGSHEAVAEDRVPVPIDQHTSRQWVPFIDEPLRQREPIGLHTVGQRMKRSGNSGSHFFAEVHVVASQLNVRLAAFVGGEFSQDRHRRRRLQFRESFLGGRQLIASRRQFGSDRQIERRQLGTLSIVSLLGRSVEDREDRGRCLG